MNIRHYHIALILITITIIMCIVVPQIPSALFMFLFLGIIPGSTMTLPAWASIAIFGIPFIFAVIWLFEPTNYVSSPSKHDKARRASARRSVLRKTAITASKPLVASSRRKQVAKA